MGDRPRRVSARKRRFLKAIASMPNVSAAARAAGVARGTPYRWAEEDENFKAAWEEAEQEGIDRLEAEAWRRAHDGDIDYVVSQGKLVYITDEASGERKPLVKRVRSDALMTLLLKAHRPERYRDRQSIEHSGPGGAPIRQEVKADVSPEFVAAVLGHLRDAGHADPAGDPPEPVDTGRPEEAEQ
jgi:hypothetical protein